jgi:UDP-N-acetylmuramoyl-tripeptide--D-alanyl-D-alanine ligase
MKRGSNQLILDAYNANPTSMQAAITNFAALQLPNKELWIGGMKEMGIAEADEHQQLVQLIEKYDWKRVLLVGKEFKGISHSYLWFETATEALPYVADHLPNGSSILIKGSRGSKMETLLAALPTD